MRRTCGRKLHCAGSNLYIYINVCETLRLKKVVSRMKRCRGLQPEERLTANISGFLRERYFKPAKFMMKFEKKAGYN